MNNLSFEIEAYTPAKIARRVDNVASIKAQLGLVPLLMLAILAGAFIAFGALVYTVVVTDSTLGLGPTRLLGGISFSVSLILVIIFPIAVFVSIGFEHSIANMYVLPVAMIGGYVPLDISGLLFNLFFVTIGNIVGGGFFVALVYWLIYLYPKQ